MQSSSLLLLFLAALLVCLLTPSTVSADGSIQPYIDMSCTQPTGNISRIGIVTSPECQWVTINGDLPISFQYECNAYANFSLSVWSNSTDYCEGEPDFSLTSTNLASYCSTATYADANNHVLFYAELSCTADWQSPNTPSLKQAAVNSVQRRAQSSVEAVRMIPQLTNLLPHMKNSALDRLARQLKQQKEQ